MNERQRSAGKVYFIGAGPGAIDLITLRGKNIIDAADCIIYAGSLVNKDLFSASTAAIYDSSGLDLEEIVEIMAEACSKNSLVARVHTGDPSLFGAIKEQMAALDTLGIEYEVVPGVSSAFAAAASISAELTLPEVSQTVIFTRRGGRTPVPERQNLRDLAQAGATMMIFLSVGMISEVVADLRAGGYAGDTPTVVVQRASWPDEKIITGTLETIAAQVSQAGITKTALICCGAVFAEGPLKAASRLYDKSFSHAARSADGNKKDVL